MLKNAIEAILNNIIYQLNFTVMKTNFNYKAWLENRAEKQSTKVLPFTELTKADKIAALCQLLGKTEDDFKGTRISSKEARMWHELSTPARLQVMNNRTKKAQELLKEGNTAEALKFLNSPGELDVCEVEIWKTFEMSTLNSQIEFLLQKYGKPVDVVTVELPCGHDWVNGLIEYCKSLEVTAQLFRFNQSLEATANTEATANSEAEK